MSKYAPEFTSVAEFATFLDEEERLSYNHQELRELSASVQLSPQKVIQQLTIVEHFLERRPHEIHARGFTTSSNDRWFGPGSCPTHGGSGQAQIAGFASDSTVRESF